MRNRQWRYVRPLRHIVQWSVVVLFCVLPWLNMHEWTRIYGSLFALDVYNIPFSDPVSVFWPLAHGEFPIRLWGGLGLTLVFALVLGRFFCGWLCPYGLLSEYAHTAHGALRRLLARIEQNSSTALAPAADSAVSAGLAHGADLTNTQTTPDMAEIAEPAQTGAATMGEELPAFWIRTLILGLGITASVLFARPLLQCLSMPGTLSLLPMYGWYGGDAAWSAIGFALILPLVALGIESLTGIRLWCKWLCPQAVLLSLAALVGRPYLHVRWDEHACKCPNGHRPCAAACSMALRSRQQGGPSRGECVQCAACVAACHCKGTGALRVGLPARKTDVCGE